MTAFEVVEWRGRAATLHTRRPPDPPAPEVWVQTVTAPAIVLGSSQRHDDVDTEACGLAGVDVVHRRSGGGAVLLRPGEVTWLDVIVPRDGPGWSDDVHGAMCWLGEHLAAVLAALLAERSAPGEQYGALTVHRGPFRPSRWSSLVCFDGLGVGEVTLGGAKLVGISQRRTRTWARLQCSWYSTYDPARLVALLAERSRPPLAELAPVATIPAPATGSIAGSIAGPLAARLSGARIP